MIAFPGHRVPLSGHQVFTLLLRHFWILISNRFLLIEYRNYFDVWDRDNSKMIITAK